MNRNTGGLLRDIRNIKRNTSLFPSPQDVITSAKELKKIKSSQQINVNTFMDNKHQKIKNIDEKLEEHQSEIQKNNAIIQQLTSQFLSIKEQVAKEKEKTLIQERKNKLLKEQIERTNKLLRVKTIKVDELNRTKDALEKEIQGFKSISQKNQEYIKTMSSLRKQITNLEESLHQSKQKVQDKEKQCLGIKEKSAQIGTLKTQISQLYAELGAKDTVINNYKINVHEFSIQRQRDITLRLNLQKEIERFSVETDALKKAKHAVQKNYFATEQRLAQTIRKLEDLQSERNMVQSKMRSHQSQENRARSQLQSLKQKSEQMIGKYNQKVTECNLQTSKIQKANQKIKQLELKVCQYKDQKDKLSLIQNKFELLKGKGKSLEVLYNSMIPQIQCPYGHQLKEPVTIIPCGHNFCLGCKKGYSKQCSQCKGKLKIEAVYRNQLMDDIINIITSIKQVVQLVK